MTDCKSHVLEFESQFSSISGWVYEVIQSLNNIYAEQDELFHRKLEHKRKATPFYTDGTIGSGKKRNQLYHQIRPYLSRLDNDELKPQLEQAVALGILTGGAEYQSKGFMLKDHTLEHTPQGYAYLRFIDHSAFTLPKVEGYVIKEIRCLYVQQLNRGTVKFTAAVVIEAIKD